jgi:hypothetical protein
MLIFSRPPQQADTFGQALDSGHSAQAAAAPGGKLTAWAFGPAGMADDDELSDNAAKLFSVMPKGQTLFVGIMYRLAIATRYNGSVRHGRHSLRRRH